ncbi:MAG: hypothetical protein AB1758_05475 [Candidatus Eremiobacterota bacterium]
MNLPRGKQNGVAVMTTMLLVMVMYFLATVVVWQARFNHRLTQSATERTRRLFAAQGRVNEFVASMMEDQGYESRHGPLTPVVTRDRGVEYRTWVVTDPGYFSVCHVICRVNGVGIASLQTSRAVRRKANVGTILYTDVGAGSPDIRCYTTGGGVWWPVPNPARRFYARSREREPDGSLRWVIRLREMAGQVEQFSAYCAINGNLYAAYLPGDYDADGFSDGLPTLMVYDRADDSWRPELLPDGYRPSDKTLISGGDGGALFMTEANGIVFQAGPGAAWRNLPNPPWLPPNSVPTSMASGGEVLYARFPRNGGSDLLCWTGRRWTPVGLPSADYFTPEGELVGGDERTVVPDQMAVSAAGVLYGLWKRPGLDTVYRYTPPSDSDAGGWSANLPLRSDRPSRPLVEDVDSITMANGSLVKRIVQAEKPDEIYLGEEKLPPVTAPDGTVLTTTPVVAAGAYPTGRIDYEPGAFY